MSGGETILVATRREPVRAVAIGASAGALQALMRLLPGLPEAYPLAVVIVVHIPPDRQDLLAPLFQARCRLTVKEAEDKEPILPGFVYFGPPDYHLLVEPDRTVSLSCDAPVLYSRPSIDVMLESAADAYGEALVGVILTGANEDGARGLEAVIAAGGTGLVENPADAFASAMPAAAKARCPTAQVMSLDALGAALAALGAA